MVKTVVKKSDAAAATYSIILFERNFSPVNID
jgi:hypothetical protein